MSLYINDQISLSEHEIILTPIRAQGAGGQNVNKVASAIHLRFDITKSSLPDFCKNRLRRSSDSRITADGQIIIKAQQFRTQERNREDARKRLAELIKYYLHTPKKRKKTKISAGIKRKRLDSKTRRGKVKSLRKKVFDKS